jgi:uncharacterized membrane protein YhhN
MNACAAVAVTAVGTCALLWAEWRGARTGVWLSKPVASLGFIALAYALAGDGAYAWWVRAALIACGIGDVLLIPNQPRAFQLGIASFALGHACYSFAFWSRGVHAATALGSAVLLTALAVGVWRWLAAALPRSLKTALVAYIILITVMVAVALGTAVHTGDPRIGVGAFMFWLSDLSVARDKFVAPGFVNRAWGLPLYYAAQLLLASTLASALPDLMR